MCHMGGQFLFIPLGLLFLLLAGCASYTKACDPDLLSAEEYESCVRNLDHVDHEPGALKYDYDRGCQIQKDTRRAALL